VSKVDLKFHIDVESLSKNLEGLKKDIQSDFMKGADQLAMATYEKIRTLASEDLNGALYKIYDDNLKSEKLAEGFYVITLLEPALWIEEGQKAGFMDWLLNTVKPGKKPAKIGKDGKKYRVIPFQHNVNPSMQSPKALDLTQEIKYALKKKGVSWKKIEYNQDGSPRLGLLHHFDLETARPDAQKDIHKNSLTKGVAVYQNQDKQTGVVSKEVMTFRVISEKHEGEGLWKHPGRQGNKLFEKGYEHAQKIWDTEILPAIFAKHKGK
jgi:hypothetical protein